MKVYLKNLSIVSLVGIAGYFGYQYNEALQQIHKIEKSTQKINIVLNSNKKLKNCFEHFRKFEFLRRGGQYIPDYDNPRTLNDKIAYILDNYFMKSPITLIIGTKYFAKKYVEDKVGSDHVVKLLASWDRPEDINFENLPKQFVLKAVRGNFGKEVIIVKDKEKADINLITNLLKKYCDTSIMRNIEHNKIIAEEFLNPESDYLVDYKFFCSYGKPLFAYCMSKDKYGDTDVSFKTLSYYSVPEWKRLPLIIDDHKSNDIPKPKHFKKMLEVASKLSEDFPLIRIDLYEINDRVLVGELTEDSSGAKIIFDKVEWDFKLGQSISVPSKEEIESLIKRDKQTAQKYTKTGNESKWMPASDKADGSSSRLQSGLGE